LKRAQNQKLSPEILAEPILVGREKEFAELKRCLVEALSGKGATIFISGEAGAGKTRLTKEFLNIAEKKQVIILTGWCLSDVAVPYFPFIEAFDSYISSNEENGVTIASQQLNLKTWLIGNQAEANETLGNASPQVLKDQAFVAVAKELLFLSTKKPLILVLEDIHWADSASLSLLHYLARQASSERILILATFRSEELNTPLKDHPNPLSKVLLLMGREGLYQGIKLSGLSRDDVRRVAENMLGGLVTSDLVEKLEAYSMGNPLFVVESLRMLHQQGNLSKTNGQWSLCVDNFAIPTKVKDVILRRLDALKSEQRIILDAASVVGEKFDPKLIAAAVYQDDAEVLRALNEIAKTTLMIHCDENCCRFGHAKSREMLYQEIPPLLRKEYHSRIAQRIEADQETDGFSINDLAFHYAQAGNKENAVKYSLQAGRVALSRFSNVEAIKHFTYVVNSIGEDSNNLNENTNALEGLGDAYYANSMFGEAMKTFEKLATTALSDILRLRAFRKAMDASFQHGDTSHLMYLVKKAEPYATADRLESARILINKGRVFQNKNMLVSALENHAAGLRVFEEEYSLWDVALSLIGVGIYRVRLGKPQQGIADSLRSIALFTELGDANWQMGALSFAGRAFGNCLLEHEELNTYLKIIEIDEKLKLGNYLRLVYAYTFSSQVFERIGNFEKAMSYGLKALEISEKTDSLAIDGIVDSNLTVIYARLGDLESAEKYFEKLKKLPPDILLHPLVNGDIAKAVFFAGKSQWKKSNRYFAECFDSLRSSPQPEFESRVKLFYAWALESQGRVEESNVQVEERQRDYREAEEIFAHVNVQANLMIPIKVEVGQTFEARLDIVNTSRKNGLLVRVEKDLPLEFKVTNLLQKYTNQSEFFDLKKRKLEPFQVMTLKVNLEATKAGVFNLNLNVVYLDDSGRNKICIPTQHNIIVEPEHRIVEKQDLIAAETSSKPLIKTAESEKVSSPRAVILDQNFEFAIETAKMAFDYLVSAFVEDYMRRRIAQEKAGWRSLMKIVNEGKLSKSSMYGFRGRKGRALIELESRGLVEARFFPGERGRGGKILKLKVAYEKEIIKRLIDNRIMNKKKE
jgi:tetratricopeptide (TPR) repeat protein